MDRASRILIVDDDELVLFTLHDILELMGNCEVVTASNARDALAVVKESKFGVVVTDIRLGGTTGIELTEEVVELDPDTPVIWITAYGQNGIRSDMERLNVFACLEKPLDMADIRRVVRSALCKWDSSAPVN